MTFALAYIAEIGILIAWSCIDESVSVAFRASSCALSLPLILPWPGTQCSENVVLVIFSLIFMSRPMLSLKFAHWMLRRALWLSEKTLKFTSLLFPCDRPSIAIHIASSSVRWTFVSSALLIVLDASHADVQIPMPARPLRTEPSV
jgi:hypothetical protein